MEKLGCTMCILDFSSFSTEFGELKDEKARMLHVHPGSHLLSSPGWLELLPVWPELLPGWPKSPSAGWSLFLVGWSLFLAGWSLFLAGWSLLLAGWRFFPAGWSFFLAGWSSYFPFPICVPLNAAPSVPYLPLLIRGP